MGELSGLTTSGFYFLLYLDNKIDTEVAAVIRTECYSCVLSQIAVASL